MSVEYDKYLKEHTTAVQNAAKWMLDKLDAVKDFSGPEVQDIINNTRYHDWSKWEPEEYIAYDNYFYGKKNEEAFNVAWLHHIHCNSHHWQHWVLVTDDGEGDEKIVPLEMPKVHAFEMIADWWSFSWRSGNLYEVFAWYAGHRDKIMLHPNTRAYVESTLEEIFDALEPAKEDKL